MKLFLVRHGQTVANVERFHSGQTNVQLTEYGRQEAQQLRPILAPFRFDRVYSSDLDRAVETQQIALPGVESIQTPLLREYDVGSLAGKPFGTVKSPDGMPVYHQYGGESTGDVRRRVRKFLDMLEADPCDMVAAFAHNGVLGCTLREVLQADFPGAVAHSNNCAIHVFEFDGIRWRLLAWNYMGKI